LTATIWHSMRGEPPHHTSAVDTLVFRITPGQLRYVRILTVVFAIIAAGLCVGADYRPASLFTVLAFCFGVGFLGALWVTIASPLQFTECSPDGIRARGLGFRLRSCPWAEVEKISKVINKGATIRVTRRDGSRFTLGVPSSTAWADDRFDVKLAQITEYWKQAAGHDLAAPHEPEGTQVMVTDAEKEQKAVQAERQFFTIMAWAGAAAIAIGVGMMFIPGDHAQRIVSGACGVALGLVILFLAVSNRRRFRRFHRA
jgi:hypothetical protein